MNKKSMVIISLLIGGSIIAAEGGQEGGSIANVAMSALMQSVRTTVGSIDPYDQLQQDPHFQGSPPVSRSSKKAETSVFTNVLVTLTEVFTTVGNVAAEAITGIPQLARRRDPYSQLEVDQTGMAKQQADEKDPD